MEGVNNGGNYDNVEKLGISNEMSMVFNFPHKNNGSKFVIPMFVICDIDVFIINLEIALYIRALQDILYKTLTSSTQIRHLPVSLPFSENVLGSLNTTLPSSWYCFLSI